MQTKVICLLSGLVLAGLIGLVYADNEHDLTIDGFNNCKITTAEIVTCIGFNTVHNDNKQIEILLQDIETNQKTIIDQNAKLIDLMTPTQKQIEKIGKCEKSGTGTLCDP